MARIRSVHPGLFTDEAFVSVSPLARLLHIGLWTEADDQGLFEWKPITIKMRLLPVDNADVSTLLAELEAANMIRRYEHDGRQFGAVRNFCRFQRPKKPNAVHPMPAEFRTYVALSAASSEPAAPKPIVGGEPANDYAPPVPPKEEITPQMEDGGWREEGKEEEGGGTRAAARSADYAFWGHVVRLKPKDHDAWKAAFHAIPDLTAELTSIDAWLAAQPPEKRKGWFHATAGMLSRRHQEHLQKRKPDDKPRSQASDWDRLPLYFDGPVPAKAG